VACTDAEVLLEILHRYKALGVAEVGFGLVDAITRLPIPVLSIAEADVVEARRLMERFEDLPARDAVHLGAMQQRGIERILTYDQGFDQVDGRFGRSLKRPVSPSWCQSVTRDSPR
jgi:predicted nucleic acid-binding protein